MIRSVYYLSINIAKYTTNYHGNSISSNILRILTSPQRDAAATAASKGWAVSYLGPDVPADEISGAARRLDAHAGESPQVAEDEKGT